MTSPITPQTMSFCITDVGSTTTKACLFRREAGPQGRWSVLFRETATTVEAPSEDVSLGVRQAFEILARDSGLKLLHDGVPAIPYLSTSSAGGGLAMVVTGLMRDITSRSAEEVALGAGALILDVVALDDGRTPYEKITALQAQRPDMILLAGGFEGSALSQLVFLAELLNEASLRPKRNPSGRLPVIFGGNSNACALVERTLADEYLFVPVENIRPHGSRENPGPARRAIQELFMGHVMSQAPGYGTLQGWVDADVMPTPAAVGRILALASDRFACRILAIDIGGATTDVFTAAQGQVQRSVCANLGMSYSILNVVRTAGMATLLDLLDSSLPELEIWDTVGEKLLHPTQLPQTAVAAEIERAVAVLAIRTAVMEHLQVPEGTSVDLQDYDLIIGSGGVLCHSPELVSGGILLDALTPPDRIELALDGASIFPHLGVLSTVQPDLASALLETVGIARLGTAEGLRRDRVAGRVSAPVTCHPHAVRARQSPIARGPIRLLRELAIAGEVFVSVGEDVKPGTIVARSSRLFLRPFFLPVSAAIELPGGDPSPFLVAQVGDELEIGQLVAQRRIGRLRSKQYRTPVAGTVEKLLPDGTLLVREKAAHAARIVTLRAKEDMGITSSELEPLLICQIGQEVEEGQLLAGSRIPGTAQRLLSPVRGRVQDIDLQTGTIRLAPLRETLEINAWLPGTVVETSDRGALIQSPGVVAAGAWGQGGEAWGRLSPGGSATTGAVMVREMATRSVLQEAIGTGATGLIAAGGHLSDLLETRPDLTVILTEGFGLKVMGQQTRDVLAAHGKRLVLLDATTELRVGLRRPRIIFPEPGP
jgi:uncharacterized protein (TIGR01319 family)